jgi:hypothetical protein
VLYPLKPFELDLNIIFSFFMNVEMSQGTLFLEGRRREKFAIIERQRH